ncbi:unnamed protein product [Rotaria sp. Silwood1]|nr:unnamed protein product [Rotaria sp. Silwood1]CAF4524871.1 unnamed protein product [Rotaria sp. Silwood1]
MIFYLTSRHPSDYNRYGCCRIQKWILGASNGTTVAGQSNGALGSSAAHLYRPGGIAIDSDGNVLVGDTYNHRVQMWQQGASTGTTIAGATGSFGLSNDRLYNPFGIARDPRTGALYIADRDNHRVMSYLPGSSSGTVVAGGNGPGVKNTQLYLPIAVRFDMSTESLVILNFGANNIVRWKLGESNWTHVAGNIHGGWGVTSMHLNAPHDMVLDHWGNIYVADTNNHRIQFFKAGETNGTTIAGITGAIEADQHQLIKNSSYSTVTDSSTYGDYLDSLRADFCARAAHLRLRRDSHSLFGYGAADGTSISKSALRDGYDYDWYEN